VIRVAIADDHHAVRLGLHAAIRSEPGLVPVGAASDGPLIVSTRPLRPTLIDGPIEIRVGDVKLRAPKTGTYV